MPNIRIEMTADFICPFCYLTESRLFRALEELPGDVAVELHWKPFELAPQLPPEGLDRKEYRTRKFGSWERAVELDAQFAATCEPDGVAYRYERIEKLPNSRLAHRLAWLAAQEGKQREVVPSIFKAYWAEGMDIGKREVLASLAARAGMDEDKVRTFLAGKGGTNEVEALESAAMAKGVRSVPHLEINGVPSSGPKEIPLLVAALRQAAGLKS